MGGANGRQKTALIKCSKILISLESRKAKLDNQLQNTRNTIYELESEIDDLKSAL